MHTDTAASPGFAGDRGQRALVRTLVAVAVLAWATMVGVSRSPAAMSMMPGQASPVAALLFASMWLMMMTAMMLPAITPVVLLFRTVQRRRTTEGGVPTGIFVGGYLGVWVVAGLGADSAYAGAQALGARFTAGPSLVPYVGGAILVLAGVYQMTPLKNTCLAHCRSPLHLVMHSWHHGYRGAVRMGATHGLFCLGCCWGLMAVLFVVGLMNLGWMAVISLLILAEKRAPRGVAIGRLAGGLLVTVGVLMALQPRLFPAAGLAAGGARDTMPPLSVTTARSVSGRALAGPYALTLTVGPVWAGASTAGSTARRVELRVVDTMGMAVTDARVTVSPERRSVAAGGKGPVMITMRKEGLQTEPYRVTLRLERGAWTFAVIVNGQRARIPVRVP